MKLTISACTVSNGKYSVNQGLEFAAQINPNKFAHKRSIQYVAEPSARGKSGQENKFVGFAPETVSFELTLDGTGVIPGTAAKQPVVTLLNQLLKVVYRYDGAKHEPNHVQIAWGTFLFHGRLTSLDTDYTFFASDGEPLRAKVRLGFSNSMDAKEQSLSENKRSPDVSHVIVVRAGDTLPLLCQRIYGDDRYYPEVARHNRLDGFRRLKPGTTLHFPPLE